MDSLKLDLSSAMLILGSALQIGNARLSGLEADLGMAGGDYALALSAFFITYCLFE